MYTRTDISTVLPHDIILRRARKPQKPRRKMAILEHATRRVFSRRNRGRSFVPPSVSSLSLFSFLHHLLHPVPSPLGCLFGTGTGRWVLHFALALLLQVPGPLRTRARAREKEKERARTRRGVLQCPATPGIVTGIVIIIATVAGCGRVANGKAESR